MTFHTLIERRPMRGAHAARQDAERSLRNFNTQVTGPALHPKAWLARSGPTVRAVENEVDYVVTAEVPGYVPEDVEVFVEDGVLTVKGLRKAADWSDELSDEEKAAKSDRFERRIRFNAEIDEKAVGATCKHGLLTVTVPKVAEVKPEVRSIPVHTV